MDVSPPPKAAGGRTPAGVAGASTGAPLPRLSSARWEEEVERAGGEREYAGPVRQRQKPRTRDC